ncbi:MAG: hypothetical protein AAF563_04620 [Pseudomonadota bacterium]
MTGSSSQTTDRIVKDMALTPADFARLLPRALDGWTYEVGPAGATIGTAERGITITLTEMPRRVITSLLSIELSKVEITFRGLDPGEQKSFLERFDRTFQRGGG